MRAESVQQETAGNCQQGCGIKHKTISQQLVANIFGIECELKRAEGGEGQMEGGRGLLYWLPNGCVALSASRILALRAASITMRFKKLTTIRAS